MSSHIDKQILRLFMLIHKVCLPVVRKFFEKFILCKQEYDNKFENFLKHHKHDLYHMFCEVRCCECITTQKHQSGQIFREHFLLMYDMGRPNQSHIKKKKATGVALQNCICGIKVKLTCSKENLDFSTLNAILRLFQTCLNNNHIKWLKMISDERNKLCHLSDFNQLTESDVNTMWGYLEMAVIGLATDIPVEDYEDNIKTQIEFLKEIDYSQDKIQPIIDEMKTGVRTIKPLLNLQNKRMKDKLNKPVIKMSITRENAQELEFNSLFKQLGRSNFAYAGPQLASMEFETGPELQRDDDDDDDDDDEIKDVCIHWEMKPKCCSKEEMDDIKALIRKAADSLDCWFPYKITHIFDEAIESKQRSVESIYKSSDAFSTVSGLHKTSDVESALLKSPLTEGKGVCCSKEEMDDIKASTRTAAHSLPYKITDIFNEAIESNHRSEESICKSSDAFSIMSGLHKTLDVEGVLSKSPVTANNSEMYVDLIPDRRLEIDVKIMSSDMHFNEDNCCHELTNKLSTYQTMFTWTLSDCKQPEFWMILLDSLVKSDNSDTAVEVPCRYILSRLTSCDKMIIEHLKEIIQTAIIKQKRQVAKAVAWKLVRYFYKFNPSLHFRDMWPGIECEIKCRPYISLEDMHMYCDCRTLVIVVEKEDEQQSTESNDFFGIHLNYLTTCSFSPEARQTLLNPSTLGVDMPEIKGVSDKYAKRLFSIHRNLTLISKSPVKSSKFSTGKHAIVEQPCIQLYCVVKGVVPVGEPHFPTLINSTRTDVLEGYSKFGGQTVRIGSEVGFNKESKAMSCGTLGGFLRYRGDDAFLTCAHVVFDREELAPGADRRFLDEKKINIYCRNNEQEQPFHCGEYADYRFPPYKSNDGVSIDAAIVKLSGNCKIDTTSLAVPRYLNGSVLDYRELGANCEIKAFAVGAKSKVQQKPVSLKIADDPTTIHFESLHNLVKRMSDATAFPGITDETHLKMTIDRADDAESRAPRFVELYNQIVFNQIYFQPGDSGMGIYATDKKGRNGCVGMAIASHPNGGCIVTPIKSIFSSFNIACSSPDEPMDQGGSI